MATVLLLGMQFGLSLRKFLNPFTLVGTTDIVDFTLSTNR